jgi:cytoskeletal protein RodZ
MRGARSNQTGFSIIEAVFIVAVIGIMGATGWFVYQHNRVKPTDAATNNTTNNQQATTTQPTNTPATYTSTAGGFSFTYPAGWKVTEGQVGSGAGTEDAIYINTPAQTATQPNTDRITNTDRLSMTLWITTNPDSSPHKTAPDQTIQQLANGINLWTPSAAQSVTRTNSTGTIVCPELAIINADRTHFSYALANGQYLTLSAGYCEGQGDTTTLTYQQQLSSQEWQAAIGVMQSIQFK